MQGFWKYRKELGIDDHVLGLHKFWMEDLKNKKVLDFGCGGGNLISPYLAQNAGEYTAIDLSAPSLERLKGKLIKAGVLADRMRIICDDVLQFDWKNEKFDVIYAFSVMHHFENFEVILAGLQERLKTGGMIITFDPMNVSWASKLLRAIYRPFQPDAAWEFPFTRRNFSELTRYYDVQDSQGYLGRTKKYFFLYYFLGARKWVVNRAHRAHQFDLKDLKFGNSAFYSGLNVTLLLKNKSENKGS